MKNTKTDMTWIPSYDPDFKKMVKRVLERYGWPRGTVIGVKFMNEPWDGMSISGWGADNLRFREIYKAMAEATIEARKEYGVEVLDRRLRFIEQHVRQALWGRQGRLPPLPGLLLPALPGPHPPSTYKPWLERKGLYGRGADLGNGRLAGGKQSRRGRRGKPCRRIRHVVSIWYADMGTPKKRIKADKGREKSLPRPVADVWSPAAAVGAVVHFIGQRKFKEMLFKNGLPWVMVFDGDGDAGGQAKIDPEDGTVVVVGDLGAVFGHDSVLFRNARGPKEVAEMAKLKAQLAALPADARNKDRIPLQRAIRFGGVLSGASLTLANPDGKFHLYDIYGNEIQAEKGKTSGAAGRARILPPRQRHARFLRRFARCHPRCEGGPGSSPWPRSAMTCFRPWTSPDADLPPGVDQCPEPAGPGPTVGASGRAEGRAGLAKRPFCGRRDEGLFDQGFRGRPGPTTGTA